VIQVEAKPHDQEEEKEEGYESDESEVKWSMIN
jgi:hypothetical protein